MNPSFDFDCLGEEAARLALGALEAEGLQVVRSFDLLQTGPEPCRCPHHGTPGCTCQYSVLLVYPPVGPPATVTVHAYEGRAHLEIVLDPNAPPDAELVSRILASLVEAGGILARSRAHLSPNLVPLRPDLAGQRRSRVRDRRQVP